MIKALIIALFVSFISIGVGNVSVYAQQKDGHKEKIEKPGEKPLPEHKGGKHHKHKHKHKKKHHRKHHKKHHKHGKKNKEKNKEKDKDKEKKN